MAITKEELLSAFNGISDPLEAFVNNARPVRKTGRRFVRRIRNENGDIEEEYIDEVADTPEEDAVESGDVDEPEDSAEVGDTVVIQPDQPVTGEIVEVVEGESPTEIVGEVQEEEGPVQNYRRYRRVKNARVVRKANGSCDVLVPLGNSRNKPVKHYKTRTVTRNTKVAGCDFDDASTENNYNTIPSLVKTDNARDVVRKARAYDRLCLKNALEEDIKKVVEKVVGDEVKKSCGSSVGLNSRRSGNRGKVLRFDNYRRVRNEDGTVSIEINLDDASEVAQPIPDVQDVPMVETTPDVSVIVEGEDALVDNARTRRVNSRNRRQATVIRNEVGDNAVLEAPSTFPTGVDG